MRWCVRVVSVVSLLLLILGVVLLLLFACGQTQFFLLLGLSDPSNPEWTLVGRGGLERGTLAGYWCGLLISGVLALSTAATCWVFSSHVEGDAAALDEAVRIWEEKQVDLAAGHLQPGDVVASLRDGVPAHTRLGHLFQAWSGPGKTGDVESFIEARASVPRQILVYLVTVASALVLIGLVGNFFGLAEAVRQIPDLKQAQGPARAQAGVKAQPPASGTETGTVRLGSGKTVTKLSTYDRSREQGPSSLPVAAYDRSGSLLSKISAGLSVVVVSSVMGIGAMLVLLLHAGAVRGTLNSLVAQEVSLVGGQLAPHLRPSHVDRLATSLETFAGLPRALQTIQASSESFATAVLASDQHIQAMAGSIGQLVRHQLVDTRQAYAQYHESLTSFSQVLNDQRGLIASLAGSTVHLVEGLAGVSREVSGLAEDSRKVHQSYRDAHVEYERYLRASLERADQQHELLQGTCRDLTSMARSEAREATETHRKVLDESARRVAGILQGQLDQVLTAHRTSLGALEGTLTASATGAREAIREACTALVEVRSSFQKVYDRTTASFDACLQELLDETRASMQEAQASAAVAGDEARTTIRGAAVALTEVRRKFHEVYDRVSTSFENATVALLELHEESYGRLQQTQVGAVAEMVRQVADHGARQGELLSTVARAQERQAAATESFETVQRNLSEQSAALLAACETGMTGSQAALSGVADVLAEVLKHHADEMRDLLSESATSYDRLEAALTRLPRVLVEHLEESRRLQEMPPALPAPSDGDAVEEVRDEETREVDAREEGARDEAGLAPEGESTEAAALARRPFFRSLVAERQSAGRAEPDVDVLGVS